MRRREWEGVPTVHLPHGLHEVVWVLEADEAIPTALLVALVPDHLRFLDRRVLRERPRQACRACPRRRVTIRQVRSMEWVVVGAYGCVGAWGCGVGAQKRGFVGGVGLGSHLHRTPHSQDRRRSTGNLSHPSRRARGRACGGAAGQAAAAATGGRAGGLREGQHDRHPTGGGEAGLHMHNGKGERRGRFMKMSEWSSPFLACDHSVCLGFLQRDN